jgi:hypothetical protein
VECERLETLFAEAGGSSDHKLECYRRAADVLRRLLRELGISRRPSPKDITPSLHDIVREQTTRRTDA